MKARDLLLQNIEKDEHIIWEGKPCNINVFENISMLCLILRWIFSIFLIVFGMKYFDITQGNIQNSIRVTFTVFVLFFGVFNAIKPWRDGVKYLKNTFYILTNKRVILYKVQNDYSISTYINIDKIKNTCIYKNSCDIANVYFNEKERVLRKNDIYDNNFDNIVYHNIENISEFEKAISPFIKVGYE